ncbi:dual specificity protein phosphatase 3-like [Diadema antillarum]|uniref:dual specificity protein phosphatase 3-like n=1 Tax=Diadema antillarum TaxID=105358 RepID=UPI003A84D0EC
MATESSTASSSCNVEELQELLKKGGKSISLPLNPIDEVYENVYVGGKTAAADKEKLKELGITHILNCAQGAKFFHVDTSAEDYADVDIKFCGLMVSDFPTSDIKQHFDTAVSFIDEALAQENGKVLVHCVQGFSRSASVAVAYLMLRRGLTVQEAVKTVREKREIGPNSGFLKQLCALNDELHNK